MGLTLGDLGLRIWDLDFEACQLHTELVILTPKYLLNNVSFTTPRENRIHEMRLFKKKRPISSLSPLSLLFDLTYETPVLVTPGGGGGMGGSLANSWPDEALCCPSDDIRTLERPLIGQQQPLIGQIDLIKSIKNLRGISLNGGGLF